MNCDDVQDLIDGYVDGELDLVRSLEIEQHLQKCVTCMQEYKNRQILHRAISNGNFYYRAPASLQKRIQSSMKSSPPPLRGIAWRTLIAAAALTLLLIVAWNVVRFVMLTSTTNSLTQEVLASHIRSLMPGHLVDVSSSNQHTVKPWFNGKLDFSPPVVDLAQQGYPLIGGRLDYVRNKAVAVLVYQHGGHVINLFVWPEGQNEGQGTTSITQQGYHILSWNRSGMSYWVVSDLEEAQLQEFVRLVQQNTP
ncbi:membrane protein [Reticulibacter mediterranei]|uniref:Membrane protein n=1 Tax=Reticulibacter mediterranei TaxID=2778369 RepID=A0A8J3IUU0_9CHLR|nr:anti-sigma factor [Reticulibacter mediterranei]GHO98938.1 membrane protein [Reticulibacter mediterranei]